ncbi:MAG: FtsQ-type POTRA domain-containing protein, partial [Cutibacterium granulosum]|nr:FtsQ-type POTRA domain-containing protein [Cutibacterium granulosum]
MSRSITDITGAIDVKRHRRQRRRRTAVVVTVGIAVLMAVAVVVVRHSTVFAVEHVDVTGVRMLKADQVRDAASISPGTPLARVDVDHVASSVAAMPDVADVTVSRHWPRTVQI